MSREHSDQDRNQEVGVELKYCEHCGGLWVRERGAGVYCGRCQSKVADLPLPIQRPRRLNLPVRAPTVVEGYDPHRDVEDSSDVDAAGDMEAVGGVA